MSDMVERVAKIIAIETWKAYCEGRSGIAGEALPEPNSVFVDDARVIARAAIEAMREPTPEMLASYKDMAGNELCWDADAETLAIVYRRVIDAALVTEPAE